MWYYYYSTIYLLLLYRITFSQYHPKNSTTVRIWPLDISNLLSVDFEIHGVVQGKHTLPYLKIFFFIK